MSSSRTLQWCSQFSMDQILIKYFPSDISVGDHSWKLFLIQNSSFTVSSGEMFYVLFCVCIFPECYMESQKHHLVICSSSKQDCCQYQVQSVMIFSVWVLNTSRDGGSTSPLGNLLLMLLFHCNGKGLMSSLNLPFIIYCSCLFLCFWNLKDTFFFFFLFHTLTMLLVKIFFVLLYSGFKIWFWLFS